MNSTNNNSFEIAAKKVFNDLYALIKEDENMTLKDDKPKPINLLDLSPDILNIIGDFIKKDNKKELMMKKELMDGEQIINGRKIIFPTFCGGEIDRSLNTKEDIKNHILLHYYHH